MKKKLKLQKEIVSVLDRKQMFLLTKGGNFTTDPHDTQEICTKTISPDCFEISANICGTINSETCNTQLCPITHDDCNLSKRTCDPGIETRDMTCEGTNVCPVSAMVCFSREDDCMVDPTVIC